MILGIESTAHTFSVAIINKKDRLLAQKKEMMKTKEQGLIPRELFEHHYEHAVSILKNTFEEAGVGEKDLTAVSFSQGPGIPNSLKAGAVIARTLSLKNNIPCVPVNHCLAHIEASRKATKAKKHVTVFVSGANTQMLLEKEKGYSILGETLDIGLGNMLDSFARELGYGFPGGPIIDKMYFKGKKMVELPYTVKGTDLVFSGVLTAAKNKIGKEKPEDLAYSLMETSFSMLGEAVERIQSSSGRKNVMITGGVAASKALRLKLGLLAKSRKGKLFVPSIEFCTDNAFMIALTGAMKLKAGQVEKNLEIKPYQRLDEVKASWI